jgi:hypothetical protein
VNNINEREAHDDVLYISSKDVEGQYYWARPIEVLVFRINPLIFRISFSFYYLQTYRVRAIFVTLLLRLVLRKFVTLMGIRESS